MGVFDVWMEDEVMAEPMQLDLSTAEGFRAMEARAVEDVYHLYVQGDDAWNRLAGRDLADVAAQLANDLMQESVSLPRGAFANPQTAGRELAVLKQVMTYVYRNTLERVVTDRIRLHGVLPSGRSVQPSPQQPQRATTTPAHRREAHKP